VPGQLDALAPDLQGVAVGEGHLRHRPGRVVVAQQQPPGLLVPDADHVPAEQRGRAGVVGVVMRVDQVGDPIDGGASNSTTPSSVVRNADW
jgi:hypothetical protein